MQNAANLILNFKMLKKKRNERAFQVSATDLKAAYYFTCSTAELISCFRSRKKKKKLTLRLSKVLTVCAKSLTLPGDAVPCPLGPEDTREPSRTSKPESKASEQLQWDSFALWPAIRYVFKPMDKNYSQHRWHQRWSKRSSVLLSTRDTLLESWE